MVEKRIWNLRFNLDEFNAAFAALDGDLERSQFLAGLSRGVNGGAPREGASSSWLDGFAFGASSRDEAEAYYAGKRAGGEKSAQVRKDRYGSAQPSSSRTQLEQTSNTTRTTPRTTPEPILNPQSLIHNPEEEAPPAPPPPSSEESLIGGKRRSWAPLFAGLPGMKAAREHFAAVVDAHDEMLAKLRKRGSGKVPRLDPSPGARRFVALMKEGWNPRVLRGCHACYLKSTAVVQDGWIQLLETFFGMPGTTAKATFEGFVPEAERLLAAYDARMAAQQDPPAPPALSSPPTLSPDFLAAAGVPLPMVEA